MPSLVGQSLGRYHILEQLGEGGMATVYKAYDMRLERDVAVKVIRIDQFAPAVLDRILKRFEREAKSLARLIHPNIVHINDYGEQDGIPYLVMDYLPGGTLKQRLGKPIAWQEAVRLVIPVAQALEYAHEQNLVHRDVKPSNILLTQKGQPMLTDFGIAKLLESEETATLTGTGLGVGTPEYMAPEQWIGNTTPQSDIYSLGIVLYEMVTGRKPFIADTPAAVLLKQASDPLPRPTVLVPDLPDVVEKVLLKALAKKPEDRYVEMSAFAGALERMLVGVSFLERPPLSVRVGADPMREDTQATIDDLEVTPPYPHDTSKPVHIPGFVPIQPSQPNIGKTPGAIKKYWLPVVISLGILMIVMFMLILVDGLFQPLLYGGAAATQGSAITEVPSATQVPNTTETPLAIATPVATATIIPTLTPTLGIGSSQTGNDGMLLLYVPAGPFTMGSDTGDADEKPIHTVTLDAFWIDQTEVTNYLYSFCVQTGVCQPPGDASYYENSQYSEHPVIKVSWNDADTYCFWAGRRLPTEAEWEKAARGTEGRTYPWGRDFACRKGNFDDEILIDSYVVPGGAGCDGFERTSPVGSFPTGKSLYGALDMAGNVWEWVADWYEAYPDSKLNKSEFGTKYQVVRGGSWTNDDFFVRATMRSWNTPTAKLVNYGFRCAASR